jgi:diguanylate cyclase (GGDEF)-like protein
VSVRLGIRDRYWLLGTWALVCLGAVLSFTLHHGFLLTALGDLIQTLLLSSLLVCILRNVRDRDRRSRLFWQLMAIGFGMWLFSQALWTHFEVVLRREVPNPFIGDMVLFLHLVPMMSALAIKPHADDDGQKPRLGSIDFVLLLIWWLYLYLFAVIPWQYISPNSSLYGRNFDALYLGEHIVFLVAAGIVWQRSRGASSVLYGNLFGAACLYAFGSLAAGIAIDWNRYFTGSFYDLPLLASMAWFTTAALIARGLPPQTEPAPNAVPQSPSWISWAAMAARLSLPMLAGWAVYVSAAPQETRTFRLLLTLGTMLLMGALANMKQSRSDEELARANQELREASLSDLLTGARNRRFLTTTIDADIQQVIRSYAASDPESKRNRDLIFYLIDADHFKAINDQYGHDVGDQVLIEFARRVSSAIRHSDVLIRWGGEEFLVVSRYTDRDNSGALAARVLAAVGGERFELADGRSVRLTCSIGWAAFPWFVRHPEAVSHHEVLRYADCALYEAKNAGRNQGIGMSPSLDKADHLAAGQQDRSVPSAIRTLTVPGPQMLHDSMTPASTPAIATS